MEPSHMIEFRSLKSDDEAILWEFLYHAIYTPAGALPVPRTIIHEWPIRLYIEDWGKPNDRGVIAFDGSMAIGAAWIRLFSAENCGFGYINEQTPELSMAVLPERRGEGIGTQLLS